jgi:hypothetical protein
MALSTDATATKTKYMNESRLFQIPSELIAVLLFILILFVNWLGFRFRERQAKRNPNEVRDGAGATEGALLGLMALMLAFSFNSASSKFDVRREVIVEEANNIGTAILRCDLYPDSIRNLFRADFKKYVEARINYYNAGDDAGKIADALRQTNIYSGNIWRRAAYLFQIPEYRMRSREIIPVINSMIDIVTTRDVGRVAKVPPIILEVLLLLTIISGFLTGYSQSGKRRNIIMIFGFALMTTITVYLILDLDRPRRGILNLDAAEQKVVELRNMFTESK